MQITRPSAATSITRICLQRCATAAAFSLMLAGASVQAQQPSFSFHNIADENTGAPGRSDLFTDEVDASLSGQITVFVGTYGARGAGNPVDYGIYTSNTIGTPVVSRVADNTNVPADGGNSQLPVILSNPAISGSNVTFSAAIPSNSYNGGARIYTGTAGVSGVIQIADLNTAVPGRSGQAFTSLGSSSVSGSNVVFTGSYNGGAGLYLNTAGGVGISRVVDSSSTFGAGLTANFTALTAPSISGSLVSFGAIYDHTATDSFYNLDGVFTTSVNGTGLTLGASVSTAVPGQSGKNFTGFGAPALSGTNLAFAGAFSGGSGVYQETAAGAGLIRVADTSTVAPGEGALTFKRFAGFATNGTNVVFSGSYGATTVASGISITNATAPSQSGDGIFLESNGSLFKILATGDPLFGSTVSDVGVSYDSYDGSEIAFSYILRNGQAGVGVIDIAVPEPSTWLGGALLLGLGSVSLRRPKSSTFRPPLQ